MPTTGVVGTTAVVDKDDARDFCRSGVSKGAIMLKTSKAICLGSRNDCDGADATTDNADVQVLLVYTDATVGVMVCVVVEVGTFKTSTGETEVDDELGTDTIVDDEV